MKPLTNFVVSGKGEGGKIKEKKGIKFIKLGRKKENLDRENIKVCNVLEHKEEQVYLIRDRIGTIQWIVEPHMKIYNLVEVLFNSGEKCVMNLTDEVLDEIK